MALTALAMLDNGIGEEVTLFGTVTLLLLAMILAWLSTHVADNGDQLLASIPPGSPHVSLVNLGSSNSYAMGPTNTDPAESQPTSNSQDNKPEEEDLMSTWEAIESDVLEDAGGAVANNDQHLIIQGVHKQTAILAHTSMSQSCLQTERRQKREKETPSGEVTEPPSSSITIRLKFINDTEELATVKPEDTVGLLKSKHFSGQERQTKLFYKGRLLQDPSQTFMSLNITHSSVIHCHISPPPPEERSRTDMELRADDGSLGPHGENGGQSGSRTDTRDAREPGTDAALNMGSVVVPLFVVALAVAWYCCITYRQLFTVPATISLMGVTIFFSFLVFGMYGR
ncbi:transmembrane and ubiquitin-like domain-containing protein 2 [Chanos chanos]|uniref:Transmembrane and ubiquitin-like domain-containing protein 2 n=1 Tax=Chanos chanos TaxID=29144 RepID=A0A6J2VDW4_CHACN|nr:transmembrane and ubiquitin-like domain-containing protein 2 [Chanos chanos]